MKAQRSACHQMKRRRASFRLRRPCILRNFSNCMFSWFFIISSRAFKCIWKGMVFYNKSKASELVTALANDLLSALPLLAHMTGQSVFFLTWTGWNWHNIDRMRRVNTLDMVLPASFFFLASFVPQFVEDFRRCIPIYLPHSPSIYTLHALPVLCIGFLVFLQCGLKKRLSHTANCFRRFQNQKH